MKTLLEVEPFWIFGSGTFALEVFELAVLEGFQVLGVLDHGTPDFSLFRGKDVRTSHISEISDFRGAPVYLAICNPYADIKTIADKLVVISADVAVKSPVELVSLFENSSKNILRYWLTSDLHVYEKSESKILEFDSLLTDEHSKNLLHSIIKYRKLGKINDIPISDPVTDQYLPKNLQTPPNKLSLIEFGSCGGENLAAFLNRGIEITGGFTFEPDMSNYQRLNRKLVELDVNMLTALPLAAWSETKLLRFNSASSTDSAISSDGDDFVQASCLDDLLPRAFDINYLKMDIEGAELEALKGSFEVLKRNRPHLAVCVYHTPEHLWEIPLWINENFPDVYRFYLRTYAEQTFETVLYCIPN